MKKTETNYMILLTIFVISIVMYMPVGEGQLHGEIGPPRRRNRASLPDSNTT